LQSVCFVIWEQGVGVPVQDVLDQRQSKFPWQAVDPVMSAHGVGVPVHDVVDQ
jgi:hypothetical protein